MSAAFVRQVSLCRAIVQPESRRIAAAGYGPVVAHQHDVSAGLQELPDALLIGRGLSGGLRGRRGGVHESMLRQRSQARDQLDRVGRLALMLQVDVSPGRSREQGQQRKNDNPRRPTPRAEPPGPSEIGL
jgi:hypothetical protein